MREFDEVERPGKLAKQVRRTGRVHIESSLKCNLGRVIDLSNGGLRVIARWAPKANVLKIRLSDDSGGLETEARIVWHIRRGFLRHELGLALPPLDDGARAFLSRAAARHRWKQTINDFDSKRDAA